MRRNQPSWELVIAVLEQYTWAALSICIFEVFQNGLKKKNPKPREILLFFIKKKKKNLKSLRFPKHSNYQGIWNHDQWLFRLSECINARILELRYILRLNEKKYLFGYKCVIWVSVLVTLTLSKRFSFNNRDGCFFSHPQMNAKGNEGESWLGRQGLRKQTGCWYPSDCLLGGHHALR